MFMCNDNHLDPNNCDYDNAGAGAVSNYSISRPNTAENMYMGWFDPLNGLAGATLFEDGSCSGNSFAFYSD